MVPEDSQPAQSAPSDEQIDGPPKKKRGGSKPGERRGGRRKGIPNKAKAQQRLEEELLRRRIDMEVRAEAAKDGLLAAQAQGKKLAKNVLSDFMELFAGMAAFYQPVPAGQPVEAGRQPDENKFKEYAALAVDSAKALAPFQSPRFSAMMIGATVVSKIVVEGGMPSDFDVSNPAPALPAGTIISADDEGVPEVLPPLKVVGG